MDSMLDFGHCNQSHPGYVSEDQCHEGSNATTKTN